MPFVGLQTLSTATEIGIEAVPFLSKVDHFVSFKRQTSYGVLSLRFVPQRPRLFTKGKN